MKIEQVPTNALIAYSLNNVTHPDAQVDRIANSVRQFGWTVPLLISRENVIIAGHGRLLAAKKLGLTEVPCVRAEDMSEADQRAYRILDNKLTRDSEWDFENLSVEFEFMKEDGFDFAAWGMEDMIPKAPEDPAQDDEYAAGPLDEIVTVIKRGDVIELGRHRMLCGDSTSRSNVADLMHGEDPALVFTDPPYGVSYVSRVDVERRKNWGEIANDNLEGDDLRAFLEAAVSHFPDADKYICCNWQSVSDFFSAYGKPNALIVWDKMSIGLGGGYRNQHEFILFYGKLDHNSESNVWQCKREAAANYVHPTQKPVEIPARAIRNSSKPGELVVDMFLGSGSTLIACEQLGRTCYGMELEPKYCQVIIDRYKKFCETNHRPFDCRINGESYQECPLPLANTENPTE